MNWTLQVLGFIPNVFGVWSAYEMRKKRVIGWALGLMCVLLWGCFDVYIGAWTALIWIVVLSVQQAHGWIEWRRTAVYGPDSRHSYFRDVVRSTSDRGARRRVKSVHPLPFHSVMDYVPTDADVARNAQADGFGGFNV